MSKKDIIESKLKSVSDTFTVNMFDNGYMLEINGRDHENEWATSKIVCSSLDDVYELIETITNMKRD